MAHHLPHYTVLVGLIVATAAGFILFPYDRMFQIALVVALAVSYVTWGIVHHWIHDDLYFEVVLEYLSIAILGSAIVISVIL
ncbi:hypothetical protein HY405_00440 [Candidatus Microgenomates bacterium]|nr:hypothetical protein [Candidatus Microgenomates bacterium]